MLLPPAVNFHINALCNLRCRFCYATFRDVPGQLELAGLVEIERLLREAGVEKLNFAGGEPTLHPDLGAALRGARELGFVVSIVTNGARLRPFLNGGGLDWVGLSVDSAREDVQPALGRGYGQHVHRSSALAKAAKAAGIRLKLNTVVTALNWAEDMMGFVRDVAPERWKVFQVRAVGGQNDGAVDDLLVSAEQFEAFLERHEPLRIDGLAPVAEDNDAMVGTYAMIDPLGRFFAVSDGRHEYSAPILDVGVDVAFSQVSFDLARFEKRGESTSGN